MIYDHSFVIDLLNVLKNLLGVFIHLCSADFHKPLPTSLLLNVSRFFFLRLQIVYLFNIFNPVTQNTSHKQRVTNFCFHPLLIVSWYIEVLSTTKITRIMQQWAVVPGRHHFVLVVCCTVMKLAHQHHQPAHFELYAMHS